MATKILPRFHSRLVLGDVVEKLKGIRHEFDVVIADPPYNIGKDFGTNSDNMPLDEYLEWTDVWIAECLERLRDNGVMYIYGFPEILARIAVRYPIEEQRWLTWHYTNKTVPSGKFWQRSHESILCLWKPGHSRPSLEIDQIREPYTDTYKKCAGRPRNGTPSRFNGFSHGRETIYMVHPNGALPRDVIKIPALAGGAGLCERWFMCCDCGNGVFPAKEAKHHKKHKILKHPTQKPMKLTTRLLFSRINGNSGRVLVPFAGSGSECLVARRLGMGWLGIEINPTYIEFAKKWMEIENRSRLNF